MTNSFIENLSIDCVVFGFDEGSLKVLLIKRNTEPAKGKMSLPGGFVPMNDNLVDIPHRRLKELTGLDNVFLREVGSFGRIDRFPLHRVVTVGYYALIKISDYTLRTGEDAQEVKWVAIEDVPLLAFDHSEILEAALLKLRKHVRYEPVGYNLLPEKFAISELQALYEVILNKKLDNRNFRKKLFHLGIITPLNEKQKNVSHRAAQLFSFNKEVYDQLIKDGISLEL